MNRLHYFLLDPTGNMTALVTDRVAQEHQPAVAAALMQNEPACEQVGFVNGSNLRMAGGEFCGNASLSAAALFCYRNPLPNRDERTLALRVFGQPDDIKITVKQTGPNSFFGTVNMPKPLSVNDCELTFGGVNYRAAKVCFSGMTHLVVRQPMEKRTAEQAVRLWCRQLQAPALGIMLLRENDRRLTPLVYVPGADTLFWESSCASGTTAAAAALSGKTNAEQHFIFDEPGGQLTVDTAPDLLQLSGQVKIEKEADFIYRKPV